MYQPREIPTNVNSWADLRVFLRAEHQAIAQAMAGPQDYAILRTLSAVPTKLIDGMTVKADGTLWNPGSGAGCYQYRGGAWRFLG